MKNTQKERIIKKLLRDGFVTRNECLRNYISRLSGIIQKLEEEGWEFDTTQRGGTDYTYTVVKCPLKKSIYKIGDKEIITYERP